MRIAVLAANYRHTFGSDVVVDLIGYRRHGHSEVDDPTVTQPRRYAIIKDHPQLYKLYAEKIGVDPSAEITAVQQEFLEDQKAATHADHKPKMHTLPDYWAPYYGGALRSVPPPRTGLDAAEIASFESERETLLKNPVATAFLDAQEEMHEIQNVVKKTVGKTIEIGRVPTADDLAEGSCGEGCGCH